MYNVCNECKEASPRLLLGNIYLCFLRVSSKLSTKTEGKTKGSFKQNYSSIDSTITTAGHFWQDYTQ